MQIRTDLAIESEKIHSLKMKAILQNVRTYKNFKVVKIEIKTAKQARILKRPVGVYITIISEQMLTVQNSDDAQFLLKRELSQFLKRKNSILVVGLGNDSICCDSIGPKVVQKVIATRHVRQNLMKSLRLLQLPSVSVISPGVLGQTGIETFEIVKALVGKLRPDIIIVVDALAAASIDRLGSTIQLTNTGIAPGSGVGNGRKELSSRVLNVPVLAIGVPTVVDLDERCKIHFKLGGQFNKNLSKFMMITPKNVDEVVESARNVIAGAINSVVFPMLSKQDLAALNY